MSLAVNMVVANSTQPLRMVSLLGFIMAFGAMLYMVYVVLVYFLVENVVAGWATRSLQESGLSTFLFLILAVLCEYVGRLLGERREQPSYFILEERNSTVLLADEDRKNVVTES